MKIITHEDILKANISPALCLTWVDDMLRHKKEAILPPKTSLHFDDDGFFNTMPSVITHLGVEGVKIITRKIGRSPSIDSELILYDSNTRQAKALMDANWLTAMRTGAVAVHTIKNLAKKSFKTIGLLGFGNTQAATMKVLLHTFADRPLTFRLLKYKQAHRDFATFIEQVANEANAMNITIEYIDDVTQLMQNNDVIISAVTYQENDFCDASNYPPGVLIVAIHLRGFMGCDLAFDKIYCDDDAHVSGFKYYDQWAYKAEVAEVITGDALGRENDEERIIAYNVGLSLHDIYFAEQIYQLMSAQSKAVSLNGPTSKNWLMEGK